MATDLEEIIKKLSELKVTDLAKLKQMLEEHWDVKAAPAAVAAPQMGLAGAETKAVEEEATDFQIILEQVPADKKISAIKEVRAITGLGLKEAKEIVEGVPKVLKESVPKAEAEEIMKKIESAGAKATKKPV